MAGMTVGQLSVVLGLVVPKSEWAKGQAYIDHFRRVALGFGAVFGGRLLGKAFIGFNMQVEDAKNQIASMLAVAKNTSLNSQLKEANDLYDGLRLKAAELPGETQDYVKMLGMLVDPLARAGASTKEMQDITVASMITSKSWGDQWQAAARDLGEFINFGKINKVDRYLRRFLSGTGIDATDEGRKKAEAMGREGRMRLVRDASNRSQIKEMQTLLANSFSGRVDKVKDSLRQIMGKIGEGLFNSLKGPLSKLADWLDSNKGTIMVWAEDVGSYIAGAFEAMQAGVEWLMDHQDILAAILTAIGVQFTLMAARAIVAWLAAAWPMLAGAGLFLMFQKLFKVLGPIPTIMLAIGGAALLMWMGVLGPIGIVILLFAALVAGLYESGDSIEDVFGKAEQKIQVIIDKVKAAIKWIEDFIQLGKDTIGYGALNDTLKRAGFDPSQHGVSDATGLSGSGAIGNTVGDATANPGLGDFWNNMLRDGLGYGVVGDTVERLAAPMRADSAKTVIVNVAPANVSIQTQDAAAAKAAFDNNTNKNANAALRQAARALGGE